MLHAPEDLEPLFKFPIHLSVRTSRENYRQIYGKSKANLWRNLSTGTPPDNPCFCSFSLQLIFFSEQPFYDYGNYSTLDSHTNTVISTRLPTRQGGVENRERSIKDNNKARVLGRRTFAC